jgi:predicted phosphodiesterase
MNSKNLRQVKNLLNEGYGRRKIAQVLDITEWAARKLIADVTENENRADSGDQSAPRMQKGKQNVISTPVHMTAKRTKISVKTSAGSCASIHKTIERDISTKVAVLSDIHYPYEDEKAVALTDMFLQDYQPDIVVYNGDVADCYAVSSYQKAPDKLSIQGELDYTRLKMEERKHALPNVKSWFYLEGNHENRFKRLLAKDAPALQSIRSLKIEQTLGLDELGITWVPDDEELWVGKLMFTHGHVSRKHAGSSARAHFEQYGCSVLVGHCHRLAIGYKRNKQGIHTIIENGTLCDFDVEYTKFPDWQQGFTTVDFDGDEFSATSHAIQNYKLISGGKVYAI